MKHTVRIMLVLAAAVLVGGCGHRYGIKEGDCDHTALSTEQMKAQQEDIELLREFYELYLSDETVEMTAPVFDSTGAPVTTEGKCDVDNYLAPQLRYQLDGLDYDPFLGAQDRPKKVDFYITPIAGQSGWYEMNYVSFGGNVISVHLEVKNHKIRSIEGLK